VNPTREIYLPPIMCLEQRCLGTALATLPFAIAGGHRQVNILA